MTPVVARGPRTERGARTREGLIGAARSVFGRQGFAATRMSDIAAAAGVSHGTVYTYFTTKEEVLLAAVTEVVEQLRGSIRSADLTDPLDRIGAANARYLEAFHRNARLLGVVEEASLADQRFAELLDDLRRTHVDRVAAQIQRQQRNGLAHDDIDPHMAAASLCAMVEGFSRHWRDSGTVDDPDGHRTLTLIWQRALGLPNVPDPGPGHLPPPSAHRVPAVPAVPAELKDPERLGDAAGDAEVVPHVR